MTTPLKLQLQGLLDNKTKPPASLGRLEQLAVQLGMIQGTTAPVAAPAHLLLFAADHGVCDEGIAPYPQAVTAQMVMNICAGGAASSVLARQHGIALTVIDVGVLTVLPAHPQLVQAKVRSSSRNLAREPAMSDTELAAAFACGRRAVADCPAAVLLIGEMGIGNTTPATALACVLLEADPQDMTGPGTGLDAAGVAHKADVIAKAMALHGYPVGSELKLAEAEDVLKLLSCLGGLEITAMVGAYLQAAAMRKVIVIDGMIATAALACALALEPAVLAFCVFSHTSSEPAHRHLLAMLRASPLLDLQLRLGEGSGALCAYPLLVSACAIINGMASFEAAGVSGKAAD